MVSVLQPFTANHMEIPQSLMSSRADEKQSSPATTLIKCWFCTLLALQPFVSSAPGWHLSRLCVADSSLFFGKGQMLIGSSMCFDFWWIPSNNPRLVFVIVTKDTKTSRRDSSFSLVHFLFSCCVFPGEAASERQQRDTWQILHLHVFHMRCISS